MNKKEQEITKIIQKLNSYSKDQLHLLNMFLQIFNGTNKDNFSVIDKVSDRKSVV